MTKLAAVIGYYLWLFYGTALIFPVDQTLFSVLLGLPPGLLLLGAVVNAIQHKDSIP